MNTKPAGSINWPSQLKTNPVKRNLTIIWDDEKQALLERIQALESRLANIESINSQLIQPLAQRVNTLEDHIVPLKKGPLAKMLSGQFLPTPPTNLSPPSHPTKCPKAPTTEHST